MTTGGSDRTSSDAIGVLFGSRRLDGCRASKTLLGRVRYRYASVDITDGDVNTALIDLLQELGAKDIPLPIAAAIPTDECYFATRPIASGAANASPRALLRESLRSSVARLDQMGIDVIHWQPDRRAVAGICAAPNERIEAIRTAVAASKHSLRRLEPAAACLIGVSPEREGRDRKNALVTRVLLGETSLLAVMSRGSKPIHWQSFPLPAGDEATGIVSAIRSLEAASGACGLDRTSDSFVIHGRAELQMLIDQNWLEDSLDGTLRWVASPTLQGADVAQAAADRLLSDEDDGFDLVRQHRDPLKLHRVVPYKEIVAYLLAASVLTAILWGRLDSLKNDKTALVTSAPPMVIDGENPKLEKDQLSSRASAVSQFLDKRVRWSTVLSEITAALPEDMSLESIAGTSPLGKQSRKSSKSMPTTLVLAAKCKLQEDGSLPTTLNSLAETLHQLDSVKPHFESVELSDVRRVKSQETGASGAVFSVILTGKTTGAR